MKKASLRLLSILISFILMSLIIRHDVPDERFIELAKDYPQICHLSDGEATLISENWVVTAAHAAIGLQEEMKYGESPLLVISGQEYKVDKVVLHPEFHLGTTSIEHDIALIQFMGSITDISYARLYDQQDEKGMKITIVGRGDFGTGISGPQKWDGITRAATNKIEGVSDQWVTYNFDEPGSESITALEGVSGPGDSGGPAFVDIDGTRYIVGVSSHQMDNGKEGVYGVTEYYARISSYKNWIEETIKL